MSKHKKNHIKYRTVGIALLEERVLIHQFSGSSYWSLPGGRIEVSEDSREALKREFKEETGRLITVDNLVWTTENFFTRPNGKAIHEVAFYHAITVKGSFKENFIGYEKDTILNFRWVPTKTLPQYPLKPSFLITALQKPLPNSPQHLIIRDNQLNRKAS